ncbi:hypothetical protein BJ170DRAFT_398772 [Xylariales sp. AK1849]|nr:hypothetical protein BJ170DRAFT_398772 [Xylariales sp. AK1849]
MGSLGQTSRLPADIKEIAVIGAGISGITSAAHLLRQGLHVTVFERSSVAGGVWHYDPRVANEPPYPNDHPPTPNRPETNGDGSRVSSRSFDDVSIVHAPPGPCYKGLCNNVPTSLMRSTLMDWPEETPEFVSQDLIEKYVQDLAVHTGVQEKVLYDTNVETVSKDRERPKWVARTRTLRKTGADYEYLGRQWEFDAVIVGSGHYHEPRVPNLPGLQEWKARYPEKVMHSKRYRTPEIFRGKTILLIGAGVSSLDVARESQGVAKKVYQSARGGEFDIPANSLPGTAERVGAIDRFVLNEGSSSGQVLLQDGRTLSDIDNIVLGTGYITSYPFLGNLQDPSVPTEQADEKIIISSDGFITHNLHKDMFYIPDPTLIFVGVPYYTSTFSLFNFQAEVVARVLAGKVRLPSQEAMLQEYEDRRKGLVEGSKTFHSLMKKEVPYMNGILEWVNRDAATLGYERMTGVGEKWLDRYAFFIEEMQKRRDAGTFANAKAEKEAELLAKGLELAVGA